DSEPRWDHASHLGYSVGEVNPKYALQNFPQNGTPGGGQVDNAGVDIRLTQLRNLLAGTRPILDPIQAIGRNGDPKPVVVNGDTKYLPNGLGDAADDGAGLPGINNNVFVDASGVAPVAGRWGEPQGVPGLIRRVQNTNAAWRDWFNRVGPGRSPTLVSYDN